MNWFRTQGPKDMVSSFALTPKGFPTSDLCFLIFQSPSAFRQKNYESF